MRDDPAHSVAVALVAEVVVAARAEAAGPAVAVPGEHVGVAVEHPARGRGGGGAEHDLEAGGAEGVDGAVEPVEAQVAGGRARAGTRRIRRCGPRGGRASPCGRRPRPTRPRASVRGSSRRRGCGGSWRGSLHVAIRVKSLIHMECFEPAWATRRVARVRRPERVSAEGEGRRAGPSRRDPGAAAWGGRGIAPARGQAGARGSRRRTDLRRKGRRASCGGAVGGVPGRDGGAGGFGDLGDDASGAVERGRRGRSRPRRRRASRRSRRGRRRRRRRPGSRAAARRGSPSARRGPIMPAGKIFSASAPAARAAKHSVGVKTPG